MSGTGRVSFGRGAFALGLALCVSASAQADIVFDGFDGPGGGFHPTDNLVAAHVRDGLPLGFSSVRAAARFTVSGGSFTLDSVTLPISFLGSVPGDLLRVRLTEDAGGAPGATVEVLSENEAIWPAYANPFTTATTLPSLAHPALIDGESYWIVTEPTSIPALAFYSADFRWFYNSIGGAWPTRQQQVFGSPALPSDPWPGAAFSSSLAFRVEGTPEGVGPVACTAVGAPGNACDTQPDGCFGAVAYDYEIATYETTNAEYAEFLNAVAASDPNVLWNEDMISITRSGVPESYVYDVAFSEDDAPVNATTFYSTLRYANWLHNGQPVGAQDASTTEDGAYTFSGPTTVGPRNPDALFALPSEDEWYKAAYYDATAVDYYLYPAGTSQETTCAAPTSAPNTANCWTAVGTFTDVGSYPGSPSPAGTFDQGGNVWEWNEATIGSDRGIRGGSQGPVHPATFLGSGARASAPPSAVGSEVNLVGFRVVCLPEPGVGLALVVGAGALAALGRARGGSRSRE